MTTFENLQERRSRLSPEKRALLEKRLHGQIAPADETPAIPRRQAGATIPASFAQQRLWFFEQLEPGTATSTIPTALRIRGKLNISALRQSLDEMMRRHEILRTTFGALDGKPVQHVHATWSVPLTLFDFRTSPEEQKSDQVLQFMKQEVQKA